MICLILWDKCRLKSGGLLGKLEAAAGGSIMVLWMNEILLKKYATAMEPPLLSWAWIWGERKFCTILKFLKLDKLLNLCEIFECVWVALKFAVDQICPSWIPARFSGHSCSEAAAPIILLLTLSPHYSKVSSSNCEQQQLLFCAHDDPLFQGLELSTLFLLNICC